MAARRKLPSVAELKKMVEKGMTHQAIADKISVDIGEPVSRVAISVELSRNGLTDRVRYDELIPWRVRKEHQKAYDLWMLRTLARQRRGKELTEDTARRLSNWLKNLDERGIVIHYDPSNPAGFLWVTRKPEDTDVIRQPA